MATLVQVPLEDVKARVTAVLPRFEQVAGAYLFGSCLDRCRPDSDLDLGLVLFPGTEEPPGWGFAGLEAAVETALGRIAGHAFHVSALRLEQVLFALKVIREGLLVYCLSEQVVGDFVERVARAHHDLGYRHRLALREVLGQ